MRCIGLTFRLLRGVGLTFAVSIKEQVKHDARLFWCDAGCLCVAIQVSPVALVTFHPSGITSDKLAGIVTITRAVFDIAVVSG